MIPQIFGRSPRIHAPRSRGSDLRSGEALPIRGHAQDLARGYALLRQVPLRERATVVSAQLNIDLAPSRGPRDLDSVELDGRVHLQAVTTNEHVRDPDAPPSAWRLAAQVVHVKAPARCASAHYHGLVVVARAREMDAVLRPRRGSPRGDLGEVA